MWLSIRTLISARPARPASRERRHSTSAPMLEAEDDPHRREVDRRRGADAAEDPADQRQRPGQRQVADEAVLRAPGGPHLAPQQGEVEDQVEGEADDPPVDQHLEPPVVQVRDAGEVGQAAHAAPRRCPRPRRGRRSRRRGRGRRSAATRGRRPSPPGSRAAGRGCRSRAWSPSARRGSRAPRPGSRARPAGRPAPATAPATIRRPRSRRSLPTSTSRPRMTRPAATRPDLLPVARMNSRATPPPMNPSSFRRASR